MGVGKPDDIVGAVLRGIDMFDCVYQLDLKNGQALSRRGPINIKNSKHKKDARPLDPDCNCYTCLNYSRSISIMYSNQEKLSLQFYLHGIIYIIIKN